ncbi:transmembrane signal receptor [Lithospermum erythrorhizon]|uniref:Transmembrane signal receptor n=1 Tax=Lithospermum erythrorhizon TaxID=34254 RepID=A0AAV3Q7M0_LITER
MMNAKAVVTPLASDWHPHVEDSHVLSDPTIYRRLVGRLLYLNISRPDLTFSVNLLSQFMQAPTENHWSATLHVVKYLIDTQSHGLYYAANTDLTLHAYCDADWGTCPITRGSITGFCVMLGSSLVSWKSKKQHTVSRSSTESEYRSAAATVCELKWMSYILQDLCQKVLFLITLKCDNRSAIHIIENPVFHERTKHIEMDCHLIRDHYKSGFVDPVFVSSRAQLADVFTKILPGCTMSGLLVKMAFLSQAPSCGGDERLSGLIPGSWRLLRAS